MPDPNSDEAFLHLLEANSLCFSLIIKLCTFATCERRSRLDDDGFACFALESEPCAIVVLPATDGVVFVGEQEVSAEASPLAPALIDAMNGVVAVDGLVLGFHLDVPLFLVAIRGYDDVNGAVLLGCDAEDCSVTAGRHFRRQMLFWKAYGVVVRMRDFVRVTEVCGAFLSRLSEFAREGGNGERAIVLRATA